MGWYRALYSIFSLEHANVALHTYKVRRELAILEFNKKLRVLLSSTLNKSSSGTLTLLQLLINLHGKEVFLNKVSINLETVVKVEEIEIYTLILNKIELEAKAKFNAKKVLIKGRVVGYIYDKKEVWYVKKLDKGDVLLLKKLFIEFKNTSKIIIYFKNKSFKEVNLSCLENFLNTDGREELRIEFLY